MLRGVEATIPVSFPISSSFLLILHHLPTDLGLGPCISSRVSLILNALVLCFELDVHPSSFDLVGSSAMGGKRLSRTSCCTFETRTPRGTCFSCQVVHSKTQGHLYLSDVAVHSMFAFIHRLTPLDFEPNIFCVMHEQCMKQISAMLRRRPRLQMPVFRHP